MTLILDSSSDFWDLRDVISASSFSILERILLFSFSRAAFSASSVAICVSANSRSALSSVISSLRDSVASFTALSISLCVNPSSQAIKVKVAHKKKNKPLVIENS